MNVINKVGTDMFYGLRTLLVITPFIIILCECMSIEKHHQDIRECNQSEYYTIYYGYNNIDTAIINRIDASLRYFTNEDYIYFDAIVYADRYDLGPFSPSADIIVDERLCGVFMFVYTISHTDTILGSVRQKNALSGRCITIKGNDLSYMLNKHGMYDIYGFHNNVLVLKSPYHY